MILEILEHRGRVQSTATSEHLRCFSYCGHYEAWALRGLPGDRDL